MEGVGRRLTAAVAAFAAATAAASGVKAGEYLDGLWMDSDGEVILEWGPCGNGRCAKVAWLKQPLGPEGLPLSDYRNPDPKLRSRLVCGLDVATGFTKQSDGTWDGGSVYVPDEGKSYSGLAEVLSPTAVKVTGYIGLPIFGESEVWTKVLRPVDRCWVTAPKSPEPRVTTQQRPAPAPRVP